MKRRYVKYFHLTIFILITIFSACKKNENSSSTTQEENIGNITSNSDEQQKVIKSGTDSAAKETAVTKTDVVNTANNAEETTSQTAQSSPDVQAADQPESKIPVGFALINGGTFTMGSPASEQGRINEESPQHTVTVSSFYMAKYPVTQGEYERIMGKNPSYFKGANLPVEQVDWFDAVEYCNKKSQHDGLNPAYLIEKTKDKLTVKLDRNANGYRLPTEAQWEYACRAGTVTPFSTGRSINTNQANFTGANPYDSNVQGEDRQRTTAVGSFAPNPWGLYDMHGNVFEWCWDWYGVYKSDVQEDPDGAASGTKRVYRGGSWMSNLPHLRSAYRYSAPPDGGGDSSIGFRLALGL
ncbi:serine/threonine-protein kinase [Treponema sp. R8-4-B8]